jgi:hypothetical protein
MTATVHTDRDDTAAGLLIAVPGSRFTGGAAG